MPIAVLLQGVSLGLTAAASPGPLQAYLISQTLTAGWRRGAAISFAPLISDTPIVLLMLFLLNQMPPFLLRTLYLGGSLFLLYLAWGLWRQWRAGGAAAGDSGGAVGGLWRGVVTNLLNPIPYTFWALVNGPILLQAWRQSPWYGVIFLVAFYGLLIGSYLVMVVVFHQARRLGPRVVRGLLLASIVILVVFAGLLGAQGIKAILA
jgi:threonine/homoserine/homoserine lactone efflux protein